MIQLIRLFKMTAAMSVLLLFSLFSVCSSGIPEIDKTQLQKRAYSVLDSISGVNNAVLQERAINYLRTLKTPRSFEILRSALNNESEAIKRQAAYALAFCGDSTVHDMIFQSLKNKNWFIRLSAVRYLRYMPYEKVLGAVPGMMNDPDQAVRMNLVEALGYIDRPEAVPYLIRLAKSNSREIQERAYSELARQKYPEARSFISKELNSSENEHVRKISMFISKSADSSVVSFIAGLSGHEDVYVRRLAAIILGVHDTVKSREVLTGLLSDNDTQVRQNAVLSLAQLHVESSIPDFILFFEDFKKGGEIFWNALSIAAEWGNTALEIPLVELYDKIPADDPLKLTVGCILLKFNNSQVKAILQKAVNEQENLNALTGGMFRGMKMVRDSRFIPFLLQLTEHSQSSIREQAESLLLQYEDDRVLRYIRNLLDMDDLGSLKKAVAALGQWAGGENEKAKGYLLEALCHEHPAAREAAAYKAGDLKLNDALPYLQGLLDDEFAFVKLNAAWAVLNIINADDL